MATQVGLAAGKMRGFGVQSAAGQLLRAAESIPANIAEGYGRGVSRDGLRFFRMAKASADEVESHLRVAGAARRLPPEMIEDLLQHTIRVRYLILRFAASIERRL